MQFSMRKSKCDHVKKWVRVVVFNTTFNNISVILWRKPLPCRMSPTLKDGKQKERRMDIIDSS
jgi:hypothetical protein